MNPDSDPRDPLESFIDRVLREQPPLQAPASLEQRVFAEIARRTALPWWRKSFAHWPLAARAIFVVACGGFAKLGLEAVAWFVAPLDSAARAVTLPHEVSWIQALVAAIASVGHNLPSLWIYGAAGILAVMYVALFGISAAAYRTLYAAR